MPGGIATGRASNQQAQPSIFTSAEHLQTRTKKASELRVLYSMNNIPTARRKDLFTASNPKPPPRCHLMTTSHDPKIRTRNGNNRHKNKQTSSKTPTVYLYDTAKLFIQTTPTSRHELLRTSPYETIATEIRRGRKFLQNSQLGYAPSSRR
jgi:hypothetical protein